MYKKTHIANGLRVVTCEMPGMQSIALGIWIKAGGRYENKQNKGIAHFLEHLIFKGSKKYSCRKIKESIEGVGGSLNGFTSEELTCYFAKLPRRHLDLALDVLSDMVINPQLKQEEIDKERTVIIEEIKMYKDLPQSHVYELLDELLWPKQPLGMSIAGTIESVSAIGRDGLSGFKNKYYNPAGIVISAAGMLGHDELTAKIEKLFSGFKKTKPNTFAAAKQKQQKPQLSLLVKETEQTHLALGFHGIKREHPLKYAVSILHIILGANMSSRLFNELREKRGLVYEIGSQVKRYSDTGAFIVHAGVDNRKAEEAIPLILKELARIKDKLVTRDEFKRAKDFYLGQLMLALEDTLDQMSWIGESAASLDKIFSLEQVVSQMGKVKIEDVREAAQQIFNKNRLNLALIGPLKGRQENLEQCLFQSQL